MVKLRKFEDSPKVSVIIPTYNNAKFIGEAIDSVLNQTYQDFEIIVVDDGSTDNTEEVLSKYKNRIRYIYQKNKGPAAAKNKGILASQSKYIATLDSDDIWLPQKLQLQVDLLDSNKQLGLVYTDTYQVNIDDKSIDKETYFNRYKPCSGRVLDKLLFHNFIPSLTVMMRRSCLEKAGLFDESLYTGEDWDLWLRIAEEFPIDYINIPLGKRRIHKTNVTRKSEERMILNDIKILKKRIEGKSNFPDHLRKVLNRKFAHLYHLLGKEYLISGAMQKSREQFKITFSYRRLFFKNLIYYFSTFLKASTIRFIKQAKQKKLFKGSYDVK